MFRKLGKIALLSMLVVGSLNATSSYKKCVGCHGDIGQKKALGKSKVIKDMTVAEIKTALHGYQNGTYGASMKGLMQGQVSSLNDNNINEIANFISKVKAKKSPTNNSQKAKKVSKTNNIDSYDAELILTDVDIKIIDATKSKITKADMIKLMKKLSFNQMWNELSIEDGEQILSLIYYETTRSGTNYLTIHNLRIPIKHIKKLNKNGIIEFSKKVVLTNKKTKPHLNYYPNNPYREIEIFDIKAETGYDYEQLIAPLSKILYVLQKEKYKGTITKDEIDRY